jgi:NTE family protein
MNKKKKTVSLVLGSGGARGLAHIGIIEWMEEHGLDIRSIAGCSMGALIGGIYAAGKLDVYKKWVLALEKKDVLQLLDLSFSSTGLFKGERVIEQLKALIGDCDIEELPLSFTAVATDIEQQKEVWLTKGPLFDAIRASIAVPTVFTPYKIDGRHLLDGGMVNPLPIAPTLSENNDYIVAVDLGARPEEAVVSVESIDARSREASDGSYHKHLQRFIEELQQRFGVSDNDEDWNLFDVVSMSFDTMQNTLARMKQAAYTPDITIHISRDAARSFEFFRAAEMIELGRASAEKVLAERL